MSSDSVASGQLIAVVLWGPIVIVAGVTLLALRHRYLSISGAFAAHQYATHVAIFLTVFGILGLVQAFVGVGWSIAFAGGMFLAALLSWAVARRRA